MQIWADLDAILATTRYMRFSLSALRDWDDARNRKWTAVIYMENGKVLARASSLSRDEAIVQVVKAMKSQTR